MSIVFSFDMMDFDGELLQFQEFMGNTSADLLRVSPVL
jgi:hypothetical protein